MAITEIFEESVIGSSALVKLAGAFLVGLMILGGLITGTSSAQDHQSATFSFTENPHDGDVIQLNSHIFEFDNGDGVSADHIPVQIGPTMSESVNNWKTTAQNTGYNAEYNTQ
jgi:hypothetical protein